MENKEISINKLDVFMNIIARLFIAFLLSCLPLVIGLVMEFKKEWDIIPLIILGFILQFGLAIFQLLPYFKKINLFKLNIWNQQKKD